MSNKNKTISFRVSEDKFDELRAIADDEDLSLSKVFRDYVDTIVSYDGRIELAPEGDVREEATDGSGAFPFTVEVPKTFIREHERIELECEHLREQLDEYKQYAATLEDRLDEQEASEEEMVRLEDVDLEAGTSMLLE